MLFKYLKSGIFVTVHSGGSRYFLADQSPKAGSKIDQNSRAVGDCCFLPISNWWRPPLGTPLNDSIRKTWQILSGLSMLFIPAAFNNQSNNQFIQTSSDYVTIHNLRCDASHYQQSELDGLCLYHSYIYQTINQTNRSLDQSNDLSSMNLLSMQITYAVGMML